MSFINLGIIQLCRIMPNSLQSFFRETELHRQTSRIEPFVNHNRP